MGRLLGEVAARIRGRPWGQNATRLAILEAARRIAACDGAEAVSLSRTADEAGFARPTVYGHFRNKEELVISVIADDIITLGRLMKKTAQPTASSEAAETHAEETEPENTETHSVEPVQEALETAPQPANDEDARFTPEEINAAINEAQPEEEVLELNADDALASEPVAHEEEGQQPEPESSEGLWQETHEPEAQPESVAEEAGPVTEVQAPEPAPVEENPRAERRAAFPKPRVDAWLERRLRVFEHTLAETSARIEKAERMSERAEGSVAEGMRDMQQHFDAAESRTKDSAESLIRRIEAIEQRNIAAIANLRAELERSGSMPKAEALVHEDKLTFIPALPDERKPKSEASDSYLDAARRAASAAAELAETDNKAPLMGGIKWPANDDMRQRYTRYIIMGVAVLALTLIGAGLFLRNGSHEIRAMSPIPRMASAHAETMPSKMGAAAAPLDRVTQLAGSGNAEAALIVGLKYMSAGSDTNAAQWLERAANGHQAVGQYTLGTLYERGIGVGKNPAEAIRWYQFAADQGNRKAMYRLGIAYSQGAGVDLDYTKAAEWFEKAANAGLVDAQFNLAVLYERGEGVPQSLLDAYKWYAIAASHGDKESAARVEALSAQLASDDLQVAQKSAQEFAPTAFDRQANLEPTIADVTGP
mgnify:CR=1 FL=1